VCDLAQTVEEMARELREGDLRLEVVGYEVNAIHRVPTWSFRMVHAESGEELGIIRLRVGDSRHVVMYAGHVGYAVEERHRGHRYAERALRLMLPLARRLGIETLWVTCDPGNVASRKTLERFGAQFVETVDVPLDCVIFQNGHPRKCRYRINLGGEHGLKQLG
jgi:predicted acetyltransferase